MAVGFVSGAAHKCFFHFEFQVERMQDLDGLCNDFGTNAVTRQNCNFHGVLTLKNESVLSCPADVNDFCNAAI